MQCVAAASRAIVEHAADNCVALLLYELTLTIDSEVGMFWKPPFTRTTALFLLNRYVSLAKYPITLMTYVSVSQKVRLVVRISYSGVVIYCVSRSTPYRSSRGILTRRILPDSCDVLIRIGEVVEIIPYVVWASKSSVPLRSCLGPC